MTTEYDEFRASLAAHRAHLTRPLNLYPIELGAGVHGSINIGWMRNGAERVLDPELWLSQGFDGVLLRGAGKDRTLLRANDWGGWDTVAIGRHPGAVALEGVTIRAGRTSAVHAGESNEARVIVPEFALRLKDVRVQMPSPSAFGGVRGKWGVFTYQCDLTYENVEIDVREALEHGTYTHGFAHAGAWVHRLHQRSSGAEGFKARPDTSETAFLPRRPAIQIEESIFKDWYQPWSSRGGAAIVLQNANADVLIDRSIFLGGGAAGSIQSHMRSKAVMISAELDGYDTWREEGGPDPVGNGYVLMRRCLGRGHSEVDWGNTIVRCATNASASQAALGFWMERCGLYGQLMSVQLGNMPEGRTFVTECNTPEIREVADARGIDTTREATIPTASRKVPLSEGYAR